jgi:glycosyltransferase involved in cell wall biosynthesis
MYAIYIDSGLISGAEKRALKLCYSMNANAMPCKLLVTKRLFNNFTSTEYQIYLKHCTVIDNDLISYLKSIKEYKVIRKYSGFNRLINFLFAYKLKKTIEKNDISILHIFLHANLKLIKDIRTNKKVKTIFEITSPDYVKMVSSKKKSYLEAYSHFNAVSNSVYKNASSLIPHKKISCAPIPFFYPIEYDFENGNLFKEKENVIIFAHRLIPRKNGLLFAKVAKAFLYKNEDWTIKIF